MKVWKRAGAWASISLYARPAQSRKYVSLSLSDAGGLRGYCSEESPHRWPDDLPYDYATGLSNIYAER